MSDFEAGALAATLRACIREGDEYEAISRIGLRAADMLERQAAQLAALRAGADTEDLHAAAFARSEIRRKTLEEAAKWVDQRLADYVADHGVYDPETGSTEFPGTGEEYCGEMEEIAEGIRALADKPAAGGADA